MMLSLYPPPAPSSPGLIVRGDAYAGAEFSPCGKYRYRLWRHRRPGEPFVAWGLLNPSDATHERLDPTTRRVDQFTLDFGYQNWTVVNAAAWISTDPDVLPTLPDARGPANDNAVTLVARACAIFVCGWGGKADVLGEQMRMLLRTVRNDTHVLKLNADGTPAHPLYLLGTLRPVAW